MDPTRNTGSGKPSASSTSRPRANDSSSEEDDCIILEVLDPIPISYAFPAMPVSADPDRQVEENTVPLSAKPGAAPAPRTRKTPATDAGSSGADRATPAEARARKRPPTPAGSPLPLGPRL